MRTITEQVEKEIKNLPLIEESLGLGIINLTALARELKPKLENVSLKKTSVGAIVMSLQRLGKKLQKKSLPKTSLPRIMDITVRSRLVEITFSNQSKPKDLQSLLSKKIDGVPNVFLNLSQGLFDTTLIANQELAEYLLGIIPKSNVNTLTNLSAVVIRFEEDTIQVPGVYYQILKSLAWENINLIEIISVANELSLFFEESQIEKAFITIKQLLKQ